MRKMGCVPIFFLLLAQPQQNQIISSLSEKHKTLQTLLVTAKVGIPRPETTLIQWVDVLVAWQAKPDFLYVKGYKPLVPVYFLLKSEGGKFWFFLARSYTIYSGKNEVLEREIDIDLKLIPQDIAKGLAFPDIETDAAEKIVTPATKPNEAYVLTTKRKDGNTLRQITLDLDHNPQKTIDYNDAGFPAVEITRDNWRTVNGFSYPFRIRIRRLLPRPNEIILEIKELHPNRPLPSKVFSYPFPKEAKYVELK